MRSRSFRCFGAFLLAILLLPGLVAHASEQPTPGDEPPLPDGFEMGLPAFPGAWGGGMFARGGRGGRTIAVTNLDDSGPGSFRAAVTAEGPRTVIFRVAGVIRLESSIDLDHPYITIAGHTAPGDGVCIAGQTFNINTHDVVIRYMRFRRGNPEVRDDALGGNPEGNVIIDHCSVSWGLDENMSLYRHVRTLPDGSRRVEPARNITIQWAFNTEALDLNAHAFGSTIGGQDSTFHHNLFASNSGRVPSVGGGGDFDFRNNVIFNWGHRTLDGGSLRSRMNIINNYYKPGPATKDGDIQHRIARVNMRDGEGGGAPRSGKWYVEGNKFVGYPEVTADNWNGGVQASGRSREEIEQARVEEPFPAWPIEQHTAEEAFEAVLTQGGASLPRRDAVDERIVREVRSGEPTFSNGIIDLPAEVGGWPEYQSGPVPVDTTGDGIPDWWARKHGLDPEDPDLAKEDANGSGYTNLEEFLNGTNPTVKVDYRDFGNNVNTLTPESLLAPEHRN